MCVVRSFSQAHQMSVVDQCKVLQTMVPVTAASCYCGYPSLDHHHDISPNTAFRASFKSMSVSTSPDPLHLDCVVNEVFDKVSRCHFVLFWHQSILLTPQEIQRSFPLLLWPGLNLAGRLAMYMSVLYWAGCRSSAGGLHLASFKCCLPPPAFSHTH